MRVLGVDFGSKRVGLAISDETGTVATPIGNVPGEAIAKVCVSILQVVHDRHVTAIVVGVPWKLDGNPSDGWDRRWLHEEHLFSGSILHPHPDICIHNPSGLTIHPDTKNCFISDILQITAGALSLVENRLF